MKRTLTLVASALLLVIAAGCGDGPKAQKETKSKPEAKVSTNERNGSAHETGRIDSLALHVERTSLNRDRNTTVKVTALYDNNETEDVTQRIEWIVEPEDAVKIEGDTLTALKEGNVTVWAKAVGLLSNAVKLNIYWEVDGHRLPLEPDPKINNATLLGVDVNNNGVRDDVERWIYEKYKDKHPIHIDIAMQAARAYKLVLEHPERAKEIHDEVVAPLDCESYYTSCKEGKDLNLIEEDAEIDSRYFRHKIYFNTKERMDAYIKYDTLLSGDSYTIPWCSERKKACDFNTSKYNKE